MDLTEQTELAALSGFATALTARMLMEALLRALFDKELLTQSDLVAVVSKALTASDTIDNPTSALKMKDHVAIQLRDILAIVREL